MAIWQQKRAFLFSHPRTASNLLTRILSAQPDWQVADYIFFDAFQYTRDGFCGMDLENVPKTARQEHKRLLEEGHKQMNDVLSATKDNRDHIFFKDHALLTLPVEITFGEDEDSDLKDPSAGCEKFHSREQMTQTNPTIFTDELMLSWHPIILIRNPILIYESWLRAEGAPYPDLNSHYAKIFTTLRFQRYILEWYISQSCMPIVVDADDIMLGTNAVEKLCDKVGMKKENVLYEWAASSTPAKFQVNERFRRFLQTICNSTGIDRSKTSENVTLEDREVRWREEFGVENAELLAKRVRKSWGDYEYLRSMRLV